MLSPDEWTTQQEVAAYLHVSVQTVARMRLDGRLTWRRAGRGIRISVASVLRLLDWGYAA